MINVAIMGFGTIGSGVYEVIKKNNKVLKSEIKDDIQVKSILELREIEENEIAKYQVKDFTEIEKDSEIQIVVETMGGTKPAYEFVKRSLLAGKHVVTSNKALVAAHGTELIHLAKEQAVSFLFEASVGGGIPVIRTMAKAYAGEHIKEIKGILNGTTNFILSKMDEEGESFKEALAKAQELGYAEKDPSADIEGHDTCRKIAILSSLASSKEVNYQEIYTEGITNIDKLDFAYAKKLGASIKLFGVAEFIEDKLYSYVCPILVSHENPLYMVKSVFNGIMVEGNMLGKSMLYGSGAGKLPTASAVVADVIAGARHLNKNVQMGWEEEKLHVEPFLDSEHRYLIRFQGISVEKVKKEFKGEEILQLDNQEEFAILTSIMKECVFQEKMKGIRGIIKYIRVEK